MALKGDEQASEYLSPRVSLRSHETQDQEVMIHGSLANGVSLAPLLSFLVDPELHAPSSWTRRQESIVIQHPLLFVLSQALSSIPSISSISSISLAPFLPRLPGTTDYGV